MKVSINLPTPLKLAVVFALGLSLSIGARLAWATTFQSVTDAPQTWSNDKTLNGNLTIACSGAYSCDAGIQGNLSVSGSFTQKGAQTVSGDETVSGDAGVGGNLFVAGNVEAGAASTFDTSIDVKGFTTLESQVAISGNLNSVLGDAGFNDNVLIKGTLSANGFAVPQIQTYSDAGSTGVVSWTWPTAFTAIPVCVCSNTNATVVACDITTRTTVGVATKSGAASDVQNIVCIGGAGL